MKNYPYHIPGVTVESIKNKYLYLGTYRDG